MPAYAAQTIVYYYTDPQGTPLAIADEAGNIIDTADYHPFGDRVAGSSVDDNSPGYAGHLRDSESNLVYMQARYYDSTVGRFLSVDPQGSPAGNIFFHNRYAYANNSPIRYSDDHGDKPGDHFRSPEAAALDALQYINGRSIAENMEYQGYIVIQGADDFVATEPVRLTIDGGATDGTPNGAIGDYHTHGDWSTGPKDALVRTADPTKDTLNSANFSTADIKRYNSLAAALKHQYRGYLGTPASTYLFYDATSRRSGDLQKVVQQEQKRWEDQERIRREMNPDEIHH